MKRIVVVLAGVVCVLGSAGSAESEVQWQRGTPKADVGVQVFRSTQTFNLPTAETLQQGLWEFEISHRFLPALSSGTRGLWGLDGPVYMRLAMGYAITDNMIATLARSNYRDNVDLSLKVKALQIKSSFLATVVALQAGVGWNTQVLELPDRSSSDSRNRQYYAQLILNTQLHKKLAFGVVPSYLYNFAILSDDIEHTFVVGLYGQWYLGSLFSVLAEWNFSQAGFYYPNDAISLGIELGTGGHFFKILVTNSTALNPSQFLPGATTDFSTDQWRLGFNVTRILDF